MCHLQGHCLWLVLLRRARSPQPLRLRPLLVASLLEELNSGFDCVTLLAATFPATFAACFATVFILLGIDKLRRVKPLDQMKVHQECLANGLVSPSQVEEKWAAQGRKGFRVDRHRCDPHRRCVLVPDLRRLRPDLHPAIGPCSNSGPVQGPRTSGGSTERLGDT